MKDIKREAQEIAARIKASDTWNADDCKALCVMAGMLTEWESADGDSFEYVIYAAAEKLGVDII